MRHAHDDGFGHSLTDLMASVAVMFLLIAAIFMVRSLAQARKSGEEEKQSREAAKRFEATIQSAQAEDKTSREALQRLVAELKRDSSVRGADIDYHPDIDPYLVTIVFSENLLHFDVGAFNLDPQAAATVRGLGPTILKKTCHLVAETGRVEQITLEGHTDNQGIPGCETSLAKPVCAEPSFKNNVDLSAKRAQNVYFALRTAIGGDPKLMSCLDKHFVVSGRGPVEPLNGANWRDHQDDEQKRKNRRVVIKVRIRSDVKALTAEGP
jgi:flagellar motor protein MotB